MLKKERLERLISAIDGAVKGENVMTEKNWNEFLGQFFHCYEDENGNRPCDNGCVCDNCMTDEAIKNWEDFHKE